MNIKVIGSGCENCDKTNAIVAECVEELGIDAKIERVADLVEIVKLGVMTAPSVMIDGKIVMENRRILTVDESEVIRNASEQGRKLLERAGGKLLEKNPEICKQKKENKLQK